MPTKNLPDIDAESLSWFWRCHRKKQPVHWPGIYLSRLRRQLSPWTGKDSTWLPMILNMCFGNISWNIHIANKYNFVGESWFGLAALNNWLMSMKFCVFAKSPLWILNVVVYLFFRSDYWIQSFSPLVRILLLHCRQNVFANHRKGLHWIIAMKKILISYCLLLLNLLKHMPVFGWFASSIQFISLSSGFSESV